MLKFASKDAYQATALITFQTTIFHISKIVRFKAKKLSSKKSILIFNFRKRLPFINSRNTNPSQSCQSKCFSSIYLSFSISLFLSISLSLSIYLSFSISLSLSISLSSSISLSLSISYHYLYPYLYLYLYHYLYPYLYLYPYPYLYLYNHLYLNNYLCFSMS